MCPLPRWDYAPSDEAEDVDFVDVDEDDDKEEDGVVLSFVELLDSFAAPPSASLGALPSDA